ncbi:Nn.00g098350.m01.CDS01 [Neocucurbitaria sp. VM-36]
MPSSPTQTQPVDQTAPACTQATQLIPTHISSAIYSRLLLNSDRDEIRLLEILPGDWDQDIECTLRVVSLADNPSYRALSYVWGSAEPRIAICIDSHNVFVGPNLFFALRRLRAHFLGEPLIVWVDAICIDQSSIIDRNCQVALMGSIYSQCSELLVWLGELEEVTQKCIKFPLLDVSQTRSDTYHASDCHCKDKIWEDSLDENHTMTPSEMAPIVVSILMRVAHAKSCEELQVCQLFNTVDEMIAFRIIMTRWLGQNPWFIRMWVVQECLLAPSGSVYLGPVSFPIDMLYKCSEVWEFHSAQSCCLAQVLSLDPVMKTVLKHCFFLDISRSVIRENKRFNLLYLRTGFLDRHATLDVDHVYGMLGLSEENYGIVPDYNRSVEDVYIDLSQKFLEDDQVRKTFWIFVYAPLKHRYPNLPSWVVDWTSLESADFTNGRQSWAGFHTKFEDPKYGHFDQPNQLPRFKDKTMVIRGRAIDFVSTVGSVVDHMTDRDTWLPRFIDTVLEWRILVRDCHKPEDPYTLPSEYKPSNHDWATAWLRTLCWGHRAHPRSVKEISAEEIRIILLDARHDPVNLLLLDQEDLGDLSDYDSIEAVAAKQENPIVYQQVLTLFAATLEGKRLVLTQNDHIGLGNIKVQVGDQIWIPTGCHTPLILRPVETASREMGHQTFELISPCYVEGFMYGPERNFEEPDQEIWIV